MNLALTLTAALLLMASTATPAFADGPTWPSIKATTAWDHVTDHKHDDAGTVKVWTAVIDDGLKCLKGEATAPGKAEVFLGVAMDIKAAINWSTAGLSASEVLGGSGDVIDYYQYLNLPWPVSDRFWFLRGTKEVARRAGVACCNPLEDAKLTFWWNRVGENGGPYKKRFAEVVEANSKAVEPPLNIGGWMFEQQGASVAVSYYVCSDPGGLLPKIVEIKAATKTLPDTVGDLVREGIKRSKECWARFATEALIPTCV